MLSMKLKTNQLVIIIVVVLAFGCGGSAPQSQPQGGPVPVNMYEVKSEQVTYYDQYPATIVAVNQVDLRSELNGYVTGMYFNEGKPVKKGQTLYEIDKTRYT